MVKLRPKVFQILGEVPGVAADQALVAGLLQVEPEVQVEIIQTLLNRDHETGLKGLPAVFDKLSPDVQKLIVSNTSHLFGALRKCLHSPNSQIRLNTLEIVRRSGNPRLSYLAGYAIHDGSPKIRCEAATTLFMLTDQHCRCREKVLTSLREALNEDGSGFPKAFKTMEEFDEERNYLIAPLREALKHYESHYRPEVLESSMLLALQLEGSLFECSAIKRGKLTHAMLEILSSSLSPRFVPFLYLALCYPELRRRIIPLIAACHDPEFFAEFIRWHWLARDPNIRKHLVAIRSIKWLNDGFEATFSLPPDVAIWAPSWLLSLGISSDQKVSLLMNFMIIDNPAANRAAVWALVEINTPGSTVALGGLLDHEDPDIQRIAKMELVRRSRLGQHPNRKINPRGRPKGWVQLLERAGLNESFDDFWQKHDNIPPGLARTAGHYVFEFVPGFEMQMQTKLISQQAPNRLRALRLALVLRVCHKFQRDIFVMANDPSMEVRAAAMSALGQIGEETSRRILERAINDEVPAVQAAVINALDQMGSRGREELIADKAESPDAEVRAASIRSLLKLRIPTAAKALIDMLQDPRPDHRCAALWLVDQLKLASIAVRLVELANSDPDPRIARIALHVARRLQRVQPAETKRPAETVVAT